MLVIAGLSGCAILGANHHADAGSPLNATYVVSGETVTLVNGFASRAAAPGSTTKVITQVWGSPEFADLDADGCQDAALILVHSPGGSGTFYYVVAAIRRDDGYRGSSALLLGDRIEPQSIVTDYNEITIRFLGRNQGEPFSTPPSTPMQQRLTYDSDSNQLKVAS